MNRNDGAVGDARKRNVSMSLSNGQAAESARQEAGDVEALVRLLTEHEARWTTHGWERTYGVIHCAGACGWRLRQKVSMTDDHCYEVHRQHVAEVIAAHEAAR